MRRNLWALGGLAAVALACDDPKGKAPLPRDPAPVPAPAPDKGTGPAPAPAPDSPPGPTGPWARPEVGAAAVNHEGPFLWVTRASAGIYESAHKDANHKLGYVRRGAKVPILDGKVEGTDCPKGWYKLPQGGFVCSMVGTVDAKSKEARFAPKQPNIAGILPFPYARNAHNGTPLYKSLPPRKKMCEYEPYACPELEEGEKPAEGEKAADGVADPAKAAAAAGAAAAAAAAAASASPAPDQALPKAPEAPQAEAAEIADLEAPAPEARPWEDETTLHEVTHEDLEAKGDAFVARYMLKGFYVAVDRMIQWHGRSWYKTTKGLIAPADRMWQSPGPEFHGTEIDGEKLKLPLAWVYGAKKTAPTYQIDPETSRITPKTPVKKWVPIQLTGQKKTVAGKDYWELADGTWIRDADVRVTTPEAKPAEIQAKDRWIDIDISEQTLVAYEGETPKYATLISSGKESKNPEKDHSTPRGTYRVREKHLVTTMDGNGTAAGDLPYSIEDVPYVMYFHKSYATHGAFWHQNYGSQMSHGCVNLAPLDAKWVFLFADPYLPDGYSGAWTSEGRPGSWVVIHD